MSDLAKDIADTVGRWARRCVFCAGAIAGALLALIVTLIL